MKPDCAVVNHHENNNIIGTAAGFLAPNKSSVTSDSCTLKVHGKQAQVNNSGNGVSNGYSEACKNVNGFTASGIKQCKSGQPMNRFNGSTNFQERNGSQSVFNDRLNNNNPVLLVTSVIDQTSKTPSGAFNGNELLRHQLNNYAQKSTNKRNEGGTTKSYIRNFDVVNSAFNEKNPGSGGLFDSSLVTQVNLSAAFHDHISYTKIGTEISKTGGILIGFNGAPSSKKHQSFQEVDLHRQDESKAQVSKLKTMILTHLDFIQHQQEMLLKKDRQLQGLKQDRESLLSRLEKMEKKMSIMSKKIVSLTDQSKNPRISSENDTNFKSCGTTKSTGSSSASSSSSSSPVFSDYFSSESASNALFIKLTNDSNFKPDDDSQSSDMMVIKSDPQLSSPVKKSLVFSSKSSRKRARSGQTKLDVSSEIKTGTKSTSTNLSKKKVLSARKKQSSTCSTSSTISSLDSDKNEIVEPEPAPEVETPNKPDEIPFSFMVSNDSYEIVNMWDIEEFEQEERKKLIAAFKLRTFSLEPDESITNKAREEDTRMDCKNDELETDMIEVPSWRVVSITGSYVMEGTENTEDEVYNKRHSKIEIDERRRKRWDIQRLREQKHNEKLKQGRYYSKAAFVSTDIKSYQPVTALDTIKNEPEPVSFFPDPMDAEVIEVCDKLPLLAFGHPIPILPPKPFSIPWNSRTKCDRKISSQPGFTLPTKFKKETNQVTLFSSNVAETNVTATESTSKTIMPSSSSSSAPKSTFNQTVTKGAKSFCSTKNRSISVN